MSVFDYLAVDVDMDRDVVVKRCGERESIRLSILGMLAIWLY